MGGHSSKQTFKNTINIITNALFTQTQNCMSMLEGDNYIGVFGDGNVIDGVFQELTVRLDQKCVNRVVLKDDFQNKLVNQIVQNMKDQEVSLTEWLDASGDDQKVDITTTVKTNITTTVAQTCIATLSGMNVLVLHGSGNVIENVTQKQSQELISNCLQTSSQSTSAGSDISDNINQHSDYDSQNPLSFISDAIEALVGAFMVLVAVCFIATVMLVVGYKVLSHRRRPPIQA